MLLLLAWLASDIIDDVDRGLLNQWYHVRGERQIDSSIVLLTLGNDDISALGGLPFKRNYYALLVAALHEAGAAAVGFDIGLTEPNHEFPAYDTVLSDVVRSSGNVVFSCFSSSGSADQFPHTREPGNRFTYMVPEHSIFPQVSNIEYPFTGLANSAAGLGQTSLTEENTISLFVLSNQRLVPAFSLEILRTAFHVSKDDIIFGVRSVSLPVKGQTYTIPFSSEGELAPNYPGGTGSLPMVSVLKFLKQYDAWKTDSTLPPPLHNKIVLVGIVAAGKSLFLSTPFDNRFPATGIHAVFIDNMLHGTSLSSPPPAARWTLTLLCGLLVATLMTLWHFRRPWLWVAAGCIVVLLGSYLLFALVSVVVPVTATLIVILGVALGTTLYHQSFMETQLSSLASEQQRTENLLREKEQALLALEEQRRSPANSTSNQINIDLSRDIKKYQEEISALKTQLNDFQPVHSPPVQNKNICEFQGIVYNASSPMAEIVTLAKKIAVTDASVFILGESGTGKELIARALHATSKRSSKPFVAVNCGALTETLLESELFGHEKGAFTGAVKEKAGRFELAHEGTIFLDEIAETSEAFQVKLLRVLQEGTFERVGATKTQHVNVRVIAATNRDITTEVAQKRFREDLYYRLNVITLSLPPLRERLDDIPILATRFLTSENPEFRLSESIMNVFLAHRWNGNVRELQSVITRAVVLAKAEERTLIRLKDLPDELLGSSGISIDIEDQIIESLRAKQFGRSAISQTAEELGGFNRGTVAEYFRGYCFKSFSEANWDFSATVAVISRTSDLAIQEKVNKKLKEYLTNAIEFVHPDVSVEQILLRSKPKIKNLPQRYHQYFELLIKAYVDGLWSISPE